MNSIYLAYRRRLESALAWLHHGRAIPVSCAWEEDRTCLALICREGMRRWCRRYLLFSVLR